VNGEPETDAQLEIGHVLFIDIVGFSKLLVDEQSAATNRLNQIVRSTEQFRAAEAADPLTRLPTGDGMVLVFSLGPEAPARCAMEIARVIKDASFGVRMGIHSGPINKVVDVNDRSNIAGTGINMAQRVLDCGDAGHILISRRTAEDLDETFIVYVFIALGDKDQAFAWMEKGYASRASSLPWMIMEPEVRLRPFRSALG
jgi:class 3 adenylate cyclase